MRRLLVVVILLSLMLFMRSFQAHTQAPDNVLTLAAIGFVVLATFAVADAGTRLSLPRVTGFIITGVALGPSAANILSREVVTEMRMFNTLALGLIATSAGLELNIKSLLPLLKTLSAATSIKVLLGAPLVGLTLFAASHFIDLGVSSFEARAALATVMGVLSIGTSPSIALAILTETKAKGRLADLVLGAAVFKDLVVVVCLAIAVAAAAALLDPAGNTDSSVLLHVSRELAGSLVAGAILGGILIAYVRFVQAEMLLFVAAMILVVSELCQVFHLELLLVFIAAGFTVRNFSHYEHELAKPLEVVALPVFVVFFTIAGAGIQLSTASAIMPAALAACLVRAGVYWVAAAFGNAVGREAPVIRRNAWLAYLPQAGVTLGLVGVAAQKLPVLSSQITTTGMAIVAINLLVGPVTLRFALSRAGEIPGVKGDARDSSTSVSPSSTEKPTLQPSAEVLPDELERHVNQIRAVTAASLDSLWESQTFPVSRAAEEPSQEERLLVVRLYRTTAKDWYESWFGKLSALPSEVWVTQSLTNLGPRAGDSAGLRARLWWHRVGWRLLRRYRGRRVPVRLCARMTLELGVAKLAVQFFDAALERHFAPSAGSNAATRAAQAQELDAAFAEFTKLLELSRTPRMSRRVLHFSAIEPQIRGELAQLEEVRDEAHAARAGALWGSEVAKRHLDELRKTVSGLLGVHLVTPARDAMTLTTTALEQLGSELSELGRSLESLTHVELIRAAQRDFNEAYPRVLEALTRSIPRVSHGVRELGSSFRSDIDRLPRELRCYQSSGNPKERQGTIRRLALQDIAETHLIRRLVPTLDQSARGLSNTFVHLPREVKDCLEPVFQMFDAWSDDVAGAAGVRQRLQASISRLATLGETVVNQVEEEIDRQEVAAVASLDAIDREVFNAQVTGETTTHRLRQLASDLVRRFQPLFHSNEPHRAEASDARGLQLATSDWRHVSVDASAAGWLSQQPVRDERIYSDGANVLEQVLQLEAAWRDGQRTAVLVSGEVGSGKTSLLNMCQLEMRSSRIFRLDAESPEQAFTLSQTIANLLGCRPTESAVAYALAAQRPILLVDNLPRWLSRGAEPIEELVNILLLIARARETFWVVAVDPTLEGRVSAFATVSTPFTTRLEIPTVTRRDIQSMVGTRAERAKHSLSFRPTPLGKLLHRLGVPGDELLYFTRLKRASRGSPGRALALTLATATGGERLLVLDKRRLSPPVPRLSERLTVTQLAILLTILELGPLDLAALSVRIGSDPKATELDLSFLQSAGLLFVDNRSYGIEEAVRWIVVDELARLGSLQLREPAPSGSHRYGRWLASAPLFIAGGYLLSLLPLSMLRWQDALIAAAVALLCLPALRNVASGVYLRWVTRLAVGDTIGAVGVSGTVTRVRATHLELADAVRGSLVVPYDKLLRQALSVRRGTPYGAPVRVRMTLGRVTPTTEALVLRAAHLCPYRKPLSPVSVSMRGQQVTLEFYSWHRDSGKHVEQYLESRLARATQNQTPTLRPPE